MSFRGPGGSRGQHLEVDAALLRQREDGGEEMTRGADGITGGIPVEQGHHAALFIDQRALGGGGSDVDAEHHPDLGAGGVVADQGDLGVVAVHVGHRGVEVRVVGER
jgi:hypothetical protein